MSTLLYPNNNSNRFLSTKAVTANTTLTFSDKIIIYRGFDVATITLPMIDTYSKGTWYTVKNDSSFEVTITTEDGATIDGELTQEILPNDSISVVYGSEWHII